VLEVIEKQQGAAALLALRERVPRRLLPHVSVDRLRASAALDSILLEDGEELLLWLDSELGDGKGRILEAVGCELALRALNQGSVAKLGDLFGTVARLEAFLDHPFVDTGTSFELRRTEHGFTLLVGVVGQPRATRLLRHLAAGAIQAAARCARETHEELRISSELVADRASLSVSYPRNEPTVRRDSEPPPTSVRRATPPLRATSLSEEVERILVSYRSPSVPRFIPAPPQAAPKQRKG
jgi:hypothetical protein